MADIFLVPTLLVVLLVLIHTWFGMGVLKRGIIFTDLAITQFAALGSAISIGMFDEAYFYLWTLGFAFLSALLITIVSRRSEYIEAFIGLLYVLGASAIMLVLANSAGGMEHFRSLLANDILFVTFDDLFHTALIYTLVALTLWRLYPRLDGFVKELVFFILLAVTVTSSVHLVGVLVVFVLLIAPALVGLSQKRFSPFSFALGFGTLFSIAAIMIAYYFDLPTGYTIVFIGASSTVVAVLLRGE